MTPVLIMALWSLAAIDLPPPAMLVGYESNLCQLRLLSVPVTAEVRHLRTQTVEAAAGRSVGVVGKVVRLVAKPIAALARLNPIHRVACRR